MGREAQKRREAQKGDISAESAKESGDLDAAVEQDQQQIDPGQLAMMQMTAFEDRRFLVQTVAVGKKDPNGMRELTFPVSPMKQITLVLPDELCQHILKEFSGGIEIPDLATAAELKRQADEKKTRAIPGTAKSAA